MTDFDVYVFVLCFIVYVMLTSLSTVMLTYIYRLTKRLIALGAEDDKIKTEYLQQAETKTKVWNVIDKVVSILLAVTLCVAFAFSVYLNVTKDKSPNGIPSLKVVKSPSMSYVHEKNEELVRDGITDQIQTFDIVVTHHLPGEFELERYDIVLYEADGMTIIHRIVDIEEPNDLHPDCRHFVLQGDANAYPDRIPVYYSQMKGIYRGERIPFLGSFVLFMQSPAGWMCILLVIVGSIAAPIMSKKLKAQKTARLEHMGLLPPPEEQKEEEEAEV